MGRKLYFAILFLSFFVSAFPQSREDSTFSSAAIQNTINIYKKAIGAQARLYNGSKYQPPQYSFEEHPFFLSEDWISGDVYYDGEYFQQVPLMYDLYNGHLITEHISSGHSIQLVREKLQSFILAEHHFEKIEQDGKTNSLPQSGFYDVLYGGETKVIVGRQKVKREKIESTTIEMFYDERNRYYILKNGVFFPVKSKSSALKVLGDKKPELKKFLKKQGVSFSRQRELVLKELAGFYDSIK